MPQPPIVEMTQFTCLNCQVAFSLADMQREHYKSDWHRYNLKRKVSELPPITAEEFARRVLLVQNENEQKSKGKNYTYCTVCKKSFSSDQSFQNHLRSRKHVDLCRTISPDDERLVGQPSVKNFGTPKKTDAVVDAEAIDEDSFESASSDSDLSDADEWEEIISENNPALRNDCLFCTHHSASLTKNVKHMSVAHSFFIPYIEYLTDMRGLLLYLGEKICQAYMCIWCNDSKSGFANIEAVRSHMIDKGHTKIRSDTEASLEYLDFYDFDMASENEQMEANVDDSPNSSVTAANVKKTDDTNDEDPVTMLLPSGEVICHRSLIKYFRLVRNLFLCSTTVIWRPSESSP